MSTEQIVLQGLGWIWIAVGGLGVVLIGRGWWSVRRSRDALIELFLKLAAVAVAAPTFIALTTGALLVRDSSEGRTFLFFAGTIALLLAQIGSAAALAATSGALESLVIGVTALGVASIVGSLWPPFAPVAFVVTVTALALLRLIPGR